MEKYKNSNSVYIKNGSQENMILEFIKEHGSITTAQATYELGISQSPARIWGLKRRGVNIQKRRKEVINRYGQAIKVAEYYIPEEQESV